MKLPVPAERLRERFPSLTDDDLRAYAEVTRRLLGAASKGPALTEVMAAASSRVPVSEP